MGHPQIPLTISQRSSSAYSPSGMSRVAYDMVNAPEPGNGVWKRENGMTPIFFS